VKSTNHEAFQYVFLSVLEERMKTVFALMAVGEEYKLRSIMYFSPS